MPHTTNIYSLRNLGLPAVESVKSFSDLIRLSENRLKVLSSRADHFYKTYQLTKKTGGVRLIAQPNRELKALQAWILRNILDRLYTSPQCKGFEKGENTLKNAMPHIGSNFILNVDFEDFFSSISANRVFSVFRSLGYNNEMCVFFTNICTFSGRLPQGSPTSPKLANLTCAQLDARIQGYAGPRGIIYTRYADDITLSAQTPKKIFKAKSFLEYVVPDEGLRINHAKTEVYGSRRRKSVTGLVVSESRVGIGRERYRKLRAELHSLFTAKTANASNINGFLAYMYSVDKKAYHKIYSYISKLEKKFSTTIKDKGLHIEKRN